MTLQIAIEARDGFVLASDTKSRKPKEAMGITKPPDGGTHESKIRISERHQIAVAVAGTIKTGADPAQRFVDYLNGRKQVPESMYDIAKEWGEEYLEENEGRSFSLLIVNPLSAHSIWQTYIRSVTDEQKGIPVPQVISFPYERYRINGKDDNGAVVWPMYFRCGNIPLRSLEETKNIAALTILMGSEFCPYDVGGLEIRIYSGSWRTATTEEMNVIGDRFTRLKEAIDRFCYAEAGSSPKIQT